MQTAALRHELLGADRDELRAVLRAVARSRSAGADAARRRSRRGAGELMSSRIVAAALDAARHARAMDRRATRADHRRRTSGGAAAARRDARGRRS